MRSWRAAVVVVLVGLCLAAVVAWGWRAAVAVGFFGFFAGVATVGAAVGGGVLTRSGGAYYERLLNGPRCR
jgi:hypothetical protein